MRALSLRPHVAPNIIIVKGDEDEKEGSKFPPWAGSSGYAVYPERSPKVAGALVLLGLFYLTIYKLKSFFQKWERAFYCGRLVFCKWQRREAWFAWAGEVTRVILERSRRVCWLSKKSSSKNEGAFYWLAIICHNKREKDDEACPHGGEVYGVYLSAARS